MSLIGIVNRIRPVNLRGLSKFLSTHFEQASPGGTLGTSTQKKTKTVPIARITLVNGDQVSVATLPEAQKLAKRRDLKLVKILDLDTKTQRPIYKLMTGSEYHTEDLKQREERKKEKQSSSALKGDKVLLINNNISEHDLKIHSNKVIKWIGKRYEVRVVIHGDANNMEKAEAVFSKMETTLKETGNARILQKRQKGSEIKFQILPPKSDSSKDDSSKDQANDPKNS